MYHLYGMPKTRSTRVVWALEEIGAEYDYHLVDLMKGEGQSPDFLAMNPFGKVPVLIDGDLLLTESAAICTYLADRHPEAGLVPKVGTPARGVYDEWCFFILTELEQPLWTLHRHKFVYPKEQRIAKMVDVALWEFDRVLKVLIQKFGDRNYLVDDKFSIADIMLAHTLVWARVYKLEFNDSRIDAYLQRMVERPAFHQAKEREQAEST